MNHNDSFMDGGRPTPTPTTNKMPYWAVCAIVLIIALITGYVIVQFENAKTEQIKLNLEQRKVETQKQLEQERIKAERQMKIEKAKIEAAIQMKIELEKTKVEREKQRDQEQIEAERKLEIEKAKIEADMQLQLDKAEARRKLEIHEREAENKIKREKIQAEKDIEMKTLETNRKIEEERTKRHQMDVYKELFVEANKQVVLREVTTFQDGYLTDTTNTVKEYGSLIDKHGMGMLQIGMMETDSSHTDSDQQGRHHKKFGNRFDDDL